MNKKTKRILNRLRNCYPTDVFPKLSRKELESIHTILGLEFGISIDRLSAHYARWIINLVEFEFEQEKKV